MKRSELRQMIREELLKEGKIPVGTGYISVEDDKGNYAVKLNFHTGPNQSGSYTQHTIPKDEIPILIDILKKLK